MSSSPKLFKFSHPGIAVLEIIQHYLKINKQINTKIMVTGIVISGFFFFTSHRVRGNDENVSGNCELFSREERSGNQKRLKNHPGVTFSRKP